MCVQEIQLPWAKGNLCPLCHSCLALWTVCWRPRRPSMSICLYLPTQKCSFLLVNLRYNIPSHLYECLCVCVPCQKRVCPKSPGTAPSTRCALGCTSWHRHSYARTLNSLLYPQCASLWAHKHCPMPTLRSNGPLLPIYA